MNSPEPTWLQDELGETLRQTLQQRVRDRQPSPATRARLLQVANAHVRPHPWWESWRWLWSESPQVAREWPWLNLAYVVLQAPYFMSTAFAQIR
jgi:hypothetical protein